MTKRATLVALAERCEKAPEADRMLNLCIGQWFGSVDNRAAWHDMYGFGYSGRTVDVPAYTASLNAALTLVPKGERENTQIQRDFRDGKWSAYARVEIIDTKGWSLDGDAYAATPALALTAAALRARAAMEPEA